MNLAHAARGGRTWVAVAGAWWRSCRRRMWRSLVIVGVLAGATAGIAMAAIDGARRTSTVLDRVSATTLEPDVMILPDRPHFDWSKISRLPQVQALGILGGGLFCATDVGQPGQFCGGFAANRQLGRDVERSSLVEGRDPDADRPDETIVNRIAAKSYGIEVGMSFTVATATQKELDSAFQTGKFPNEAHGPKVKVHVVGVTGPSLTDRLLEDVNSKSSAEFYLTPAFAEVHHPGFATNALARLKPGASVTALRQGVARVTGDRSIPIRDLAKDRTRLDRALAVEQVALLIFAAVVVVAGAVLIGQAVSRQVKDSAVGIDILLSVGASRGMAVSAVALSSVLTIVSALVSAIAVTILLSPRFPIGTARSLEIHRGIHVDSAVLLIGLGALLIGLAARVLVAAAAAVRRSRIDESAMGAGGIAALKLPLPVELGTRLALARGQQRSGLASRPALVGAAVGVLGIVGAMTFRAGLDDAIGNEALAGTTWNRVVNLSFGSSVPPIPEVHALRGAAEVTRAVVDVGGETMSAWSFAPQAGELKRVVVDGRVPSGPGEVTLGIESARSLHTKVGNRVVASNGKRFSVVGIGYLPEQAGHSSYAQGLWTTPRGFARFGQLDTVDHELLVDVTGDERVQKAALAKLMQTLRPVLSEDGAVKAAEEPSGLRNLTSVRQLPLALGVFLIALAIGVLGHALVTTVQRRRHEIGVLRALGFTGRQACIVVASQATTISLVGLIVGVPLGLVAGRTTWAWVAHSVPFVYVAPFAAVAVAAVIPAALVLVNAVAASPARSAARVRPAEVLRTE